MADFNWRFPVLHVLRVIDGDTIELVLDVGFGMTMTDRVRLHGVDCPETRTRDLEQKRRGLTAKAFTTEWTRVNQRITYESTEYSRGNFGRLIGDLVCGGNSLTQSLIDAGHVK